MSTKTNTKPTTRDDVIDLAVADLEAAPFNPRKHFDDAALDELGATIASAGLLQNLVARPIGKKFQILAGERRFRAIKKMIDAGTLAASFPIPVRVADVDDKTAVRIAAIENIQREDPTPLEEARGFRYMLDADKSETTETIAAAIGKSRRHVQLRLALVDKLIPAAQNALDDGTINIAAARLLATATAKAQETALGEIEMQISHSGNAPDTDDLRQQLFGELPPVDGWPIFELDLYKGEISEDDNGVKYFADEEQARDLQTAAIEAEIGRLREQAAADKRPGVKVFDGRKNQYFDSYNYREPRKNEPALLIITINGLGLTLETYDRVKNTPAKAANKKDTGAANAGDQAPAPRTPTEPVDFVAAAALDGSRRAKSAPLQDAVADDTRLAKIVTIIGLATDTDQILISSDRRRAADFCAISDTVRDGLETFRARFGDAAYNANAAGGSIWGNDSLDTPLTLHKDDDKIAACFAILYKMSDGDLDRLFSLYVARQFGSLVNYQSDPGDKALALCVAEAAGIRGNEAAYGLALTPDNIETMLDGYKKPAIDRVCHDLEFAPAKTLKASRLDIAQVIAGRIKFGQAPYVAPTYKYLSEAEASAEITKLPPHPVSATGQTKDVEEIIAEKTPAAKKPVKTTAPAPKKPATKKPATKKATAKKTAKSNGATPAKKSGPRTAAKTSTSRKPAKAAPKKTAKATPKIPAKTQAPAPRRRRRAASAAA